MASIGFDIFARDHASSVFGHVADEAEHAGRRFSVAGAAMKAGMALGAAGMTGLAAVLKTGWDETKDATEGTAQLAAGIKSTHNAAMVSVDGLNDLASSIQSYSGQTDDSIVASEKLLLTFTNIKNNTPDKIFDLATKATADMAAKMGGDASQSAIQLGKALNDPVKGVTALQKIGVSFTDAQKKTIAAMMKTGDVAGAQKVILNELNTEFGGAAKAAGESVPGQMARARRSFEDTSQAVVTDLLPVFNTLMGVVTKYMLPGIQKASEFWMAHKTAVGITAAAIVGGVVAFKTISAAITGFRAVMTAVRAVQASFAAVQLIVNASMNAGRLASIRNTAAMVASRVATIAVSAASKAWAAAQWLLNAALSANPIALVVIGIAALVAGIIYAYKHSETFRSIVQAAFRGVQSAASAMWSFVKPVFELFMLNLRVLGTVASWLYTNAFRPAMQFIGQAVQGVWDNVLKPTFRFIADSFLTVAGVIIHGAASAFGWIPGLGGKLRDAAKGFDRFRDTVNAALDGTKKNINIKVTSSGFTEVTGQMYALARQVGYLQANADNIHINIPSNGGRLAARALGGPVMKGQPYIVGEHRAELFVPDVNGTIIPSVPNASSPSVVPSQGGGSVVVQVNGGVHTRSDAEFKDLLISALAEAKRRGFKFA